MSYDTNIQDLPPAYAVLPPPKGHWLARSSASTAHAYCHAFGAERFGRLAGLPDWTADSDAVPASPGYRRIAVRLGDSGLTRPAGQNNRLCSQLDGAALLDRQRCAAASGACGYTADVNIAFARLMCLIKLIL